MATVPAVGIARAQVGNVPVSHQILFVYVFDRLKVAFSRLKSEAVAFLKGNLEVLLLLALRGERFALCQLLVIEKSPRYELGMLLMRYCSGILMG